MFVKEVALIVKFRIDKRNQESLIRELGKLLPDIRQQRGCLHFDLYRSVDSRDWFLHQTWESQQTYTHHQHSPQATRLRQLLDERSASRPEQWQLDAVPL
jgi:quinol monooxygenase YgiN